MVILNTLPFKAKPYIEMVHDLSAYQLIDQPDWFCPSQQPMVLDLVFLNRVKAIQTVSYLPLVGKSNHLAIEIITTRCPAKSKCKRKVYTEYRAIRREL